MCGITKGQPRHKETWWWNRDVEKGVAKRNVYHKAWRKSKSAEDKHTLDVTKKEVYTAVLAAQESKLQKLLADIQSESGRKNCFRIARQMAREGRDVISVCCMKNDVGNVVSDADGMKNIWRKYMEKLLSVDNDWDGDDLVIIAPTMEQLGRREAEWRASLLDKGLKVNTRKSEVMIVDSGKWPCGVCGKGIQANSVQCTVCKQMDSQAVQWCAW